MKFNIKDKVTYVDPSLISYNSPSPEDVLIGEDFFTKKYRKPDGSTYTRVPYSDWAPTTTIYTAKDSKGNTLRNSEGKIVTGNTQQEANNNLFWDNYNNVSILNPEDPVAATKEAASYIPFIGEGLDLYNIGKDIYSGNYGQAALGAGLFILPEFGEKLARKGFNLLGRYKPNFNTRNFKRDVKTFFSTPWNENPIAAVGKNRLIRSRWKSPKVNPGPYNYTGPANSQENAINLLLSRSKYNNYNVISKSGTPELHTTESVVPHIKSYNYIPYRDVKDILKGVGEENHFLTDSYIYYKLNTKPAVAIPDLRIVAANPGAMQRIGTNRLDVALAHEYHHLFNLNEQRAPIKIFDTRHLPVRFARYLDAKEIAARGSQLKNYFGLKKDEKLTGDMLKYAAEHYSKDVFDNNMQQLFSTIKDWDAAAEWFNKNSFKHGGRLNFS